MLTELTFYFFKFKKDEYGIKKIFSLILLVFYKCKDFGETKIKEIFNIIYNKINDVYKLNEEVQESIIVSQNPSREDSFEIIRDNQNMLSFNSRNVETDKAVLDLFILGNKSEAFLQFINIFYNAGVFDKTLRIEDSVLKNLRELTYTSNRPAAIVSEDEIKLIKKLQKRLSDYDKRKNR